MATLKGDVVRHAEFSNSKESDEAGSRFSFQFEYKKDLFTIQYWKEGDQLTFITGSHHERDVRLGTLVSNLTPNKLYQLLKL